MIIVELNNISKHNHNVFTSKKGYSLRKKVGEDLKSNMQTLESFTITPGIFFRKLIGLVFIPC